MELGVRMKKQVGVGVMLHIPLHPVQSSQVKEEEKEEVVDRKQRKRKITHPRLTQFIPSSQAHKPFMPEHSLPPPTPSAYWPRGHS